MTTSVNGTPVVGQYKGRPVSLIQDHPYWHRDGHMVLKRRYEYADKYRANGKPEKEFVWPPGTKLSELRLFGWEDLKRLQPGEPIFLPEGEKTCDALAKRGFIAVCMAASTMRDYSALDDLFAYPENPIIVSPDNDDTGLKAAAGWFDHLKRSHPKVKWLPPVSEGPGDDFADLLSEYGRDDDKEARAAVLALVDEALDGPPQPTVAEVPSELGEALPLWEMAEPPPREWLVDNFIPDRWPTLLYGDGGAGKTTLVTHLALHIATGREWFGRLVKQANVLIVDAELDEIEAARRVWPLARGMSLDAPPPGVYYWRLPKALSGEDILDHLHEMVVRKNIGFVVVDSLTIATHLSDQNVSNDLLKLIFSLQKWGVPFLFIDHHAKSSMGNGDPDSTSPYGSVYKRNAVRAMTFMQTGVKGSARLHCRKSNFGPKWEPFSIGADWIGVYPNQAIVYSRLADNDPRNLALKSEETKNETLEALRVLADEYPEGVPTKAVAEYLAITEDNARMRLGRLEKMRPPQASRPDRGRWLPVNEPPPPEPNR